MLKKNAALCEKLEAALGKPLLGPGAEDAPWVPWSQQFLGAARAVAEAEIHQGKRAYNAADRDTATLVTSAARLRAAVFGDTKFARSCDSAWVVSRQFHWSCTQAWSFALSKAGMCFPLVSSSDQVSMPTNATRRGGLTKQAETAERAEYGMLVKKEPPRALDLSGIRVGDYGLKILGLDLRAGLRLESLNLSRSTVTREGVESLAETLAELGMANAKETGTNESGLLHKLMLNRCNLGCESADDIVSGKGRFARLGPESRNVALHNSLRGIEALGALLESSSGQACKLQVLQLNKARIGNVACARIAKAMETNRHVKELSLGCEVFAEFLHSLTLTIPSRASVTFRIAGSRLCRENAIGGEGAKALSAMLKVRKIHLQRFQLTIRLHFPSLSVEACTSVQGLFHSLHCSCLEQTVCFGSCCCLRRTTAWKSSHCDSTRSGATRQPC
jgi:hypothetical protein